jgi:signal transduction histidine kinase
VFLALIQVLGSQTAAHRTGVELPLLGYALLLAGPLALLVRRRARPVSLVVAMGAATAYFTLGYPFGPGFLAALVAVIGALVAGYRVLTWVVVGAAYLTYALTGVFVSSAVHPSPGRLITVGAWLLGVVAVGEAIRVRTAHFAELMRARAEREKAVADQEHARVEHRRRQASEERLRIARELHDVLGHHLSLINVQAGVGLHLMDERPEQARAALSAIKEASAEALREVRSVLGALRPDDESPPRAPAPSLSGTQDPAQVAGLRALVAEVNAAGPKVKLEVSGTPHALPAGVDRAAYRVVQEALTNVRRHAGAGAVATVRLAYGDHELVAYIADDGSQRTAGSSADGPDSGGGTGIAGMRQRVEALDGEFRAGPRAEGGFEVYARFPLGGHT